MPIINRKTSELIGEQFARGFEVVTVNEKQFYFTKKVKQATGAKEGMFMHFHNDATAWGFFVNDDPDGFTIIMDHSKRVDGGFLIASRGLARMFLSSVKKPARSRFHIVKTKTLVKDAPFFEIVTKNTVDEIIKFKHDRRRVLQHVLNVTKYNS